VTAQVLPPSSGHLAPLLGADALRQISYAPDSHPGYWRHVLEHGTASVATNLTGTPGILESGGVPWPILLSDARQGASYPTSLHTQYSAYPASELHLVPGRLQQFGAGIGLKGLGVLLRSGSVDHWVQWSSWLLSTNLHHPTLREAIPDVTDRLADAFPDRAILIRSIDGFLDPDLPSAFVRAGYRIVVSRQVYFFDGREPDYLTRSTVKRDLKELRALKDYVIVEHDGLRPDDAPRITELYRQLYIAKHSPLNPQYTVGFVAEALRHRWLEFRGLRHASGRLDGIYACFRQGGCTSTPFIGYDTSLPPDPGLYRMLVSMLIKDVAERGLILNYSSGAGEFKRRRGARPCLEFNALFDRHLPRHRRAANAVLERLANGPGRRFLEANEI
jgi:hypothetical protein